MKFDFGLHLDFEFWIWMWMIIEDIYEIVIVVKYICDQ